ncbi:MAG TPA: T9SS type A sorting domain-containing protein [Bacteroidia bacterium]|jgi:sugar lactone lactonase YvrE|nr:T9SS type A sorting domain-containing protein [Bacteroidia bacterium]
MKTTKALLYLILTGSFLQVSILGKAQIITTIAGNTLIAGPSSGDGGQATAAGFGSPSGVAVDGSGNLYIADSQNNRIRKVDIAGIITTFVGTGATSPTGDGGPATAATLNNPSSVTCDALGNLYIADDGRSCIRKVNTAGIISTIAGNGTYGFSGDGGQATAASLRGASSVVFDATGNFYIADWSNNRIRKVNTDGIIITFVGTGIAGYSGDGGQATAAQLNKPHIIALDAIGNLYISDALNDVIRKVDTLGIITTITGNGTQGFSGDGGQATLAQLKGPGGIVLDAIGNLYFSDVNNNRVRKVNTSGIISTITGDGFYSYGGDGGQATAAELRAPAGICLDGVGNLYIADDANYVVRKVTNAGQIGIARLNIKNDELSMYPNPAIDVVNIQMGQPNNSNIKTIEIFNMVGEKIYHQITSSLNCQINIADLYTGVYLLKVETTNGIETKQLIKN